ncbi:alpha-2-macroglobulin family protein [Paraflavitalea pollutisoli]|uniref:alpha-2-macroglobulin family protein n=1 Tax=Paraflavitalea pollutisoli TaxID=3034143 RepID=UPI0023ED3D84|nr:alpha-2-macroglobulin family protein [Paraflavitalea sp. H1-2-19X]
MNTYDKAWKKIDSLINKKGLPQSALTEVNKIYAQAKQEKNDGQLIKALLYRRALSETNEEGAELKSIAALEAEIATATEPAKAILQNIAASAYWNLFQRYRYRIYNRSATVNFSKADIATWSVPDFHQRISALYLASLKDEKKLQQTKLEPFDPIIVKGNVRYLRPTLFDLLAHEALAYFSTDERNIDKPADAFEITDPAAYADAGNFATHRFRADDTTSLHAKALQLYQRLLHFHAQDAKPEAWIDADIARLSFVHSYAVIDNKTTLYRQALQRIIERYGKLPIAAQASYLLANSYALDAGTYEALGDTTHRFAYLKAIEICEKIIVQKDSSEGKTNCTELLNRIKRQQLGLKTERVNIPGQPFRMLVNYRNITQVYVRVIRLDGSPAIKLDNRSWDEDYWKKVTSLKAQKTFTQSLPDTKDYQEHGVEIKAEALPVGAYALLVSANKDFTLKENALALQTIHVSNLAYINQGTDYYVLNRETGAPVPRATVQVWYNEYDNSKREYVDRKGEVLYSDAQGLFTFAAKRSNQYLNYRLDISTKEDRLALEGNKYLYRTTSTEEENRSATYFFTDRSIYRPGQIVHFKGIMINHRGTNQNAVAANFATQVYLVDANGQEVDSLTVTTNAYGSYSGRFTLPSNNLNGQFTLRDKVTGTNQSFRVEEYKRPRFATEVNKPIGTYRLNDSITVKGFAKAYAGNNIDGATVKYRVVRNVQMPYWYGWGRKIWPPQGRNEAEIAHGTTTTKADGSFEVVFKALPDLSVDKKSQPTFTYNVNADVTDINGETRSGSTTVAVAYQALLLSIEGLNELPIDSLKNVLIKSTNLNNLFEKSKVAVSLYKLKAPDRVFRSRYWEQPDQYVLSQEEYRQLFPYDLYANEDQPASWERQEKVMEMTDSTQVDGRFPYKGKIAAGWYLIEATTKDKYGNPVKALHYLQLFNKPGEHNPVAFGSIRPNGDDYAPGQTASYQVVSNLDKLFVIKQVERRGVKPERSYLDINRESPVYNIPVTENDLGGFSAQIAFVKHNRFYSHAFNFDVPFTNKELKIDFATYRDKTLPGSAEQWKVKISGIKGDQVAAEMLTAMYDASLDQFNPHSWNRPYIWQAISGITRWDDMDNFQYMGSSDRVFEKEDANSFEKTYDALVGSNTVREEVVMMGNNGTVFRARAAKQAAGRATNMVFESNMAAAPVSASLSKPRMIAVPDLKADPDGSKGIMRDEYDKAEDAGPLQESTPIQARKNFNETAFFFPDLQTDADGNITFSFTMPEALTEWKWMSLAHTKELAFGYAEKKIITQKDLMVQPNAPRFLREGDRMDFSGKIVNLSDKELTGQVELQLIDPTTNQSVDGWFRNVFPNQFFTVGAGQSIPVNFSLEIPFQYNKPVTYRLIAATKAAGTASSLSDGEENTLPVVSNRMLVTESLPLPVRGNGTKNFTFDKLLKSGESETLSQHAVTVEFTSNPAWYAVQALPYLMEYPYECAEQVFNRYYANTLATTIANASPRLKAIFERWKTADTAALLSNLQKNEELKSVLLQETPWVMEAKTEAQQKKQIGLLFDLIRMSREQDAALSKLQDLQTNNGGFAWFQGGRDDRYITQYMLTSIGHLKKLNAQKNNARINAIVKAAIPYLDKAIKEEYDQLLKNNKNVEPKEALSSIQIQYLYMRSFFPEYGIPGTSLKAHTYFRKQAQQHWLKQSTYMQGMIALALHRTGDVAKAQAIIASLKQHAVVNEEMGMYWKNASAGYYWYQHPIETQSLLIEAFTEVTKDHKAVADMKTWLLKQKQTQNWRTTKATAEACYALLLQGTDWLSNEPQVQISLGNYVINSSSQTQEAGTGYFKKVIDGKDVKPDMGNIKVAVTSSTPSAAESVSWGAVYWQYFENLDKITQATETPLKLSKKLFVERLTDRGPVLQPLNEGDALKVGDKVKVRIELRSDRAMEYVHMKDMRAACLEPVNVLSSYKWQDGLGYYESTKDASTNFFFGNLPKGTFVFEYALFVTHTGTYSNGVTTIQCMYAPEFTSHSEGVKVTVEAQ